MFHRFRSLFGRQPSLPRQHEHAVVVTISDTGVSCQRPTGLVESVAWHDLRAVVVETTTDGPFAPDVFWLLVGEHQGCVIPQGAINESALLERLQELEGFDNAALIAAMTCVENRRFVCWEKKQPPS